ncbi:MAG: hypothetical protein RBR98_01160 [Candidatus Moranbacteria bacterium]|jgi:hypothetical protein|nr:hypothetical protein [Candidatus Moranbacteria bacterium]
MGILFLIFSFIFIFSSFFISYEKKEAIFSNFRLAFIKASLVISLLVVFFTEGLSFFNKLTPAYLFFFWAVTAIASIFAFIYLFKKTSISFSEMGINRISNFFKNEKCTTRILIWLSFIIILSLFGIAFTTNNNWDSYTYHLPKVEHWIQDKNVNFFPTSNVRQLYIAPFSEYFILNIRLLSGSVLFINFVQFFSFINCLLGVSLIAKLFRLQAKGQIMAFIFALTIPMGIMQSTTTQTDLVTSFFLVSFVYFIVYIAEEKKFSKENLFFLCLGFSLGILTKSTFYIFALPFCLFFGIYYIRLFKARSFLIVSSIVLMFVLLNGSFLIRNYNQFGSPLGPQKSSSYYLANLNEDYGIRTMFSNSVKNAGLHLALPNNTWNSFIDKNVYFIHDYLIKFPVNYEKTNWCNMEYKTIFRLHHDIVGNFFHLILLGLSLCIITIKYKSVPIAIRKYVLSLIAGFMLFAFLLKWQPWQARLDLPLFILAAPLIAYALTMIKWRRVANFICMLLLFISVGVVFIFDQVKPLLGVNSVFKKDNNSYIINYDIARKIELILNKNKISNVGFVLGENSLEWQFWLFSKNRKFEHVYFHNDFTKTPNFDSNFRYKALIIEDAYLNESQSDLQINDFLRNKEDVLEVINVDEQVTLVIFKERQVGAIVYK